MAEPSSPIRGRPAGLTASSARTPSKAESHAENAAGQGEQHAFSQQLAHDARAAGSQCGADRELAFADGGAHQQQIGDIGAGDQQHQSYRAQHHQQRIARVADDAVAQWSNRKIRSPIGVRELTVVLRARRPQLGVGLRHGDARLEQSGHLKEEVHVGADRVKLKRQPEVSLRVGDEILSDHADDGVRLIAQRDRFPHDGLVAAEPALPQAVAQDHHLAAVGRVLLRREGPSQRHGRTIHAEVALRNVNPVDLLRTAAGKVKAGARVVVGHDLFKYVRLPLEEVKLRNVSEGCWQGRTCAPENRPCDRRRDR